MGATGFGRLLGLGLALALATPAMAQQGVILTRQAPAWLGIRYDIHRVLVGEACTPRVMVDGVVQGSPAERAGLRAGDAILSINGQAPDRLPALATQLVPGDSVRLRVRRDGATRDMTAVADRRPDRPPTVFVGQAPDLRMAGTPVIEVRGDTLVARNLAGVQGFGPTGSVWLRHDDRVELRHLRAWTGAERIRGTTPDASDLDHRIARLLACADSAGTMAPPAAGPYAPGRVTLREIQEQADSIRIRITRRTLEADSLTTDRNRVTVFAPTTGSGETRVFQFFGPEGRSFDVENHVAVGLRGVAGAELTAMEPELASYFRNADGGLLVLRIAPGTPAHRAGLRPGDVIVAAGERRLDAVDELRRILALPDAGGVELRVVRNGRTREIRLPRDR